MQSILLASAFYAVAAPIFWTIVFLISKKKRKIQTIDYAFYFFLSISIVFLGVFADYNHFWSLSLIMNFFYPLGMIGSPILFVIYLYSLSFDNRKLPKWVYFFFLIPVTQFLISAYAFYIYSPADILEIYFYDIVFGRKDLIPESLHFTFHVNLATQLLFVTELISTIIISFYLIPKITRKAIHDAAFLGNKRLVNFLYVLTVLAIIGIGTIFQQTILNQYITTGFGIASELFWGTGWLILGYFMQRIINIETLPAINSGNKQGVSLQQMIYEHFETKKPYLNAGFTIDQLSKDMKSNRTYISKAFKDDIGTNFTNYANGFRISYAKNMLMVKPEEKLNDVAMQSGFNSYSTFYRVFKEQTGFSPREFSEE